MAAINVPSSHSAGKQRPGLNSHISGLTALFLTFDFDSSYPTGGEAADFAADSRLANVIKVIEKVLVMPKGGYVFEWNATTKKILAYRQSAATSALTEVGAGVDLSAVTGVDVIVFYR